MIKANELRIGNWVTNDCDDTLIQVDATDILTCSKDDDWLRPIPLTPEILEAAGFKKGKYSWNMGLVDGYLSHDLVPTGKLLINDDYDEYCFDFPCQYLHQLQNLYFALTGTELEINMMQKA